MRRFLYQPDQGRSFACHAGEPELVLFQLQFDQVSVVRKKFGKGFKNDDGRRRVLFAPFQRRVTRYGGTGALTSGSNGAAPLRDLPGDLFLLPIAVARDDEIAEKQKRSRGR